MSVSKNRKRAELLKRRAAQTERAMASVRSILSRVLQSAEPDGAVYISKVKTSDGDEDCDCPLCAAMENGLGEPVDGVGDSPVHRMSEHDMMIYRQICDDMAAGKYGVKYENINRIRVEEL